ncbi:FAD-binding oxidoreductase [Pyxidicoccus parkwayensis]|uniref:FAD-binding oxidoreductase n=1 Tax=Pyxidicoccus parkwayensis TaxID=2813578 RepID=A0ABX7NSU8_9BACT|nr:FAD-binding oxidoreductase [Pyxidicoccus parkwaysis]QSQ21783.1 FAD-binding oxidoreductase [Pyxidicoccus parkwaysis]
MTMSTAERDALVRALGAGVQLPVLDQPSELEPYSHDFGGSVRRTPAAVVRVRSEQEVVHTFRVARERGVPVSVRGSGHSMRAQSLCEGGIVLENAEGAPDIFVHEDGLVEVTTRTRWGELEAALNLAGLTAPVLTDHMATSLGGTLSVAGYGARSLRYGAHLDQVVRLRLILPDGSARWCSETEDAELFRFALGGFGQVGFIERVVMRTQPYRPVVRVQQNRFASMGELVDALAWTAEWDGPSPDHFFSQQKRGEVISVLGASHVDAAEAQATPIPGPARDMVRERTHMMVRPGYFIQARTRPQGPMEALPRQYWSDYCFEYVGLRAFVKALEEGPRERYWDDNCLVRMLCLKRGTVRWPFDIRSIGSAPRLYGIGVYYRIEPGDDARAERAREAHRDFLARCLELGGRPYLYGCNELTPEQMQRLYGEDYARLKALRADLDPQGLLNRGGLP